MTEEEIRESVAKLLEERARAWESHRFHPAKSALATECRDIARLVRSKATTFLGD